MKVPQLFCGAFALVMSVSACQKQSSQAELKQSASETAGRIKTESVKAGGKIEDLWLATKIRAKFVGDLSRSSFFFEELAARFCGTSLSLRRARWILHNGVDDCGCANQSLLVQRDHFKQRAISCVRGQRDNRRIRRLGI